MANPDYIDRFEAAELLGTDPRTIQKWASQGRIQSHVMPARHGSQGRFYLRSEIERLVQSYNLEQQLDQRFGEHFSGLSDGEGSFGLNTRQRPGYIGNEAWFKISLRRDDLPMLIAIRQRLGYGSLALTKASNLASKPTARFEISRHIDAVCLTTWFDAYPLMSKKARDYAIWREFVSERCKPNWSQEKLDDLAQQIKSVRKYIDLPDHFLRQVEQLNSELPPHRKGHGLGH